MEDLVTVPGARWRVEEAIKLAKSAWAPTTRCAPDTAGTGTSPSPTKPAAAFLAVQDARTAREQDPHGSAALAPEGIADLAAHRGGFGRVHQQHPASGA
ncbi:hypothetical protein ACTWPT_20445 [Nonomuraea sp. 3N208]|uniref:hypothetical protein n=1 Tax=Nonomuraea sp. 3N208 TaxID=3457421 RepID=UPI003FCDF6DB